MMNEVKLSDTECVDMLNKSRSFVSRIQERLEMFTLRIIQINYYWLRHSSLCLDVWIIWRTQNYLQFILHSSSRCQIVGSRILQWNIYFAIRKNIIFPCPQQTVISCASLCPHHPSILGSAVKRSIGEVVQSRRRPLLEPSPGWKRLLALSHWRHY